MPTKIFVGSLGNGARPEELRALFESYGNVVECDIVNRCGFVHMENEQDAQAAIQNLNNSSFNGQTITVEYGRQKERGGGGGASRGMRPGPYDQRGGGSGGWQGRGGFNRGPMDSGMSRGGGYTNSSHSPLGGGGYGGAGRPGGSFRSNGEDRRGFALPDHDDYIAGGAGGGDLFHRRGGPDNYRNGYSRDYERGYGTDTYQQRDSGPIRRGANSYQGGRGSQYPRANDYQDQSRSSGYGGYVQQNEGYSGSGQYGGSGYSSERNTNYSSTGGRNNYGGQGTSRGIPQDQYSRRF